ncbi:hypothetical protein [Cytobacillus firmus]|uniref:hypothetical protein n=1 Tax=Cytobacillus firmus TaxID=1399 RepID=UPI001C8D000F|nr:hypothetical protein [Cytobacillus firmus]MBX9976033.1 hypothetical protein [Cytobacillus firmus]
MINDIPIMLPPHTRAISILPEPIPTSIAVGIVCVFHGIFLANITAGDQKSTAI